MMKTILDLSDKTVTVGPHDYRVFMPYTFRDVNYMGLALHGSREIKVSVTCDDDTIKPEPSILEIFIHEVLHCIDEVYFARTMFPEDVKEDKIDVLSSGLVQALGMRLAEEKETGGPVMSSNSFGHGVAVSYTDTRKRPAGIPGYGPEGG